MFLFEFCSIITRSNSDVIKRISSFLSDINRHYEILSSQIFLLLQIFLLIRTGLKSR